MILVKNVFINYESADFWKVWKLLPNCKVNSLSKEGNQSEQMLITFTFNRILLPSRTSFIPVCVSFCLTLACSSLGLSKHPLAFVLKCIYYGTEINQVSVYLHLNFLSGSQTKSKSIVTKNCI